MISGWMELTSSLGGVLGLFDLNQPDSDSSDDEGFEGFGLQSFSLREEEAKSLFEIRPRPNEPIIIEIEDDDEPNVQHPLIQPEIIVPEMKIKQERTESLTKVSKNQAKRKRDVQNRIQDILRELDLPETQLPTALQAKGPWRKSKILTAIDHDVGVITNEIHKFGRKHQVNPQQKILDDASEGQSPYPVPVFNEVDETPFPTQFEWIEKCVYREVVGASIEFLVGCDCSGSCQFGEHCTCAGENHLGGIVYATDGTLVIPPGIPIYECNMKCRCRLDCVNRVVQNPPCFPLEVRSLLMRDTCRSSKPQIGGGVSGPRLKFREEALSSNTSEKSFLQKRPRRGHRSMTGTGAATCMIWTLLSTRNPAIRSMPTDTEMCLASSITHATPIWRITRSSFTVWTGALPPWPSLLADPFRSEKSSLSTIATRATATTTTSSVIVVPPIVKAFSFEVGHCCLGCTSFRKDKTLCCSSSWHSLSFTLWLAPPRIPLSLDLISAFIAPIHSFNNLALST
eukprot:TRINITY_DN6594_c0_g1_i7.p1 TRINITY_DN6594_c0_g1~~TRINITY_DN6594_c0_g1_i7.p1  ORF type:complete len:512 (+),score=38.63 TRINITY_DN6594_c0_g1_i7:653-2188(+)